MSEHSKRKSARTKLSKMGYACMGGHFAKGGHVKSEAAEDVHKHESHLHPGKPKTKLKAGGMAEGESSKPRADRLRRGGKTHGKKSHTTVNVVVGGQHPQPVPVPVPKPVPVPVNAGAMGAGGPPPGVGPIPPPPGPGAPPMGLKSGGRAKMKIDSQREDMSNIPPYRLKKGGKVPVPMSAGAGGGAGRLEKAKDYGA